ncbi:MAG: FlgD immunoglobulin-like domain containing protein [bacterium]|nr:FlgD immunoglobulin-like domain containing protein [bacterium]
MTWTDGSSNEAGFVIYRNGALLASTAANATNYVDNPPFTTAGPYTYRVYASNTCGSNSSGLCTGTASIKPTAPTGATATGGCNNVTVTWTDASTNETGFTIYRNGALLGTAVANTGTYVDNAATSGSYTYVVWASNTCGSNSSGVCTGTPTTFPNSPTGAGATGGCNSVTVTWTDASSNETGFVIFRNGINVGSAASGAQIYTDNALTVAGAYTYRVWASNGCGSNSSGVCTGTAAVSASAPTMSVPDGDCGTITITWTDVSNETGYVIYRNGTALVSTIAANATSYVDNVTTAGPYTYRVYASNTCGSNSSGTAQGTASFTPTAPTIGTATGGCNAGLTVTWTDNSSDETRFFIYRNNVNLANTVAGATMYLDNPPFTTAGPYTYRVWASNACGSNSSGVCTGTAQINAIAPTIGTATGACNQITVTWTDNSTDEVRFVIYRSGSNIGSAAANATNYVDASLTTAGPYTYYVYASNTCGSNSSGVCTGTASVSPAAPTGAAASSDECTKVTVTWTDASSNEDRFVIYRNGVNIGSAVANTGTYVDNISTGGSYTYRVWASNTCGSNSSAICTGTVLGKIEITAPDGGETLAGSSSYTITWTATGQGGNVSLDYSTNSGTSWTSIIASTSETGSYNWSPVPEVTTTTGRVRVLRTDGPTCTSAYGDTSDADFTIEGVGDQRSGEITYYSGTLDNSAKDELNCIISLGTSAGYFGVGWLNSNLGIIKWTSNGAITFSKYMSSDPTANGYTVCKSSESGTDYYLIGASVTLTGSTKNLIIKMEDDATVSGAYRYGGSSTSSGAVGIRSIIVDGSYYIATGAYVQATSNTDVLLMKLNQDLTVSWAKAYELSDATHYDRGYSVVKDDGGYYGISGNKGGTAAGGFEMLVMRASSDGTTVDWEKSIKLGTGTTNTGYSIMSVTESATNYYVVAGYSSGTGSKGKAGASIVVVKLLASDGTISWIKNLSCNAIDDIVSVIKTSSGCYVITGNCNASSDVLLAKLNTDGSEAWTSKAINVCGAEALSDIGRSVIQDDDNTYMLGGYSSFGSSSNDVMFLKVQTDGDIPDCPNLSDLSVAFATPTYTTPAVSSSVSDLGTSIATSYTATFATRSLTTRDICGSPFSVEFTGMTANPEVGYIQLNWFTETEKDNLKWLLQRSENKEDNYTQIAEIPAKGAGPNSYVYPDSTVTPGLTFWYKLGAMDNSGNTVWYNPVSASARLEKDFPLSLKLESINPSNRTAKINYTVPSSSAAPYVNITVYNSAGQIVKILVNEKQKPGPYTIYWNGKDARNKTLGSGEYFCRLKTDGKLTYKLIRMR